MFDQPSRLRLEFMSDVFFLATAYYLFKYFDKSTFGATKEQKAFEKSLFQKTSRNSSFVCDLSLMLHVIAEIILLDGVTCIYRSNVDLYMYVLGSSRENELVLESLLNCLFDAISTVLRKNVEKKALIDAMDTCILIIDEICDEGIILETDPQSVVARCALKADEISFSDQTFSQVGMSLMSSAKEQFKWSLLK
ncbi:unnamed protein product [Angiostrongylus costaricensis]|uniref:Coatomer subunit zeta n=1 Tax=Angiostrongylus costaricensis TaxID=334426 RepID=A0A0R3PMG8_ANGCS|nr:unnamed protein product [Angiostrongylus costaricensis]